MSLKYTQAKEGDKVIIDISFHPDSTFYSTLLNKPDFSELILRQDGIKIKIPEDKLLKTKNIDVMVDGFYQILFLEEPKQRNAEFLKPKVIEQPSLEEEQAKALSERKCPECGSNKIYYDYGKLTEGEEYCSNCGLVLNDKLSRISKEREWRAYDIEEELSRTRVGSPLTYTIHDKGLHTIIDKRNRDAFNRPIKPARRRDIYKMRKWQKRMIVQNAKERNLAYALGEIKKMADNLNLPKNVIEEASVIYRKAFKERLTWRIDTESLAGAAVYLACREYGLNKSLREVLDSMVSEESEKELRKAVRILIKELFDYNIPKQKPTQYVTKFSNQFSTQGKVEEISHKILQAAKEAKLTGGRDPKGMAAAATYIASILVGERKNQRDLADKANVTEVTIRNRYKELFERLLIETSH